MRRRSTTRSLSKPKSVKDLLLKAGLNERQIAQTVDRQQEWDLLVREVLDPEWAPFVTRIEFDQGELTVWVQSAARAARVRLVLAAALLDGKLTLGSGAASVRKLSVKVSR